MTTRKKKDAANTAAAATSTGNTPTVTCPTCGKPAVYAASNPFRPFCCERCRLIDLGAWASESYRIPEQTPPDGQLPASRDDD